MVVIFRDFVLDAGMFDPVEAVKEFIRHASVSTDSKAQEGMRGARAFLGKLLESVGFAVEEVPTTGHPAILATRAGSPDWPHVVVYGHYDVQPADPLELWTSPPFEPVVRNGRLYGRGAADNKGPMMVHLAGMAQALESNPDLPVRITCIIEGEEEIGSPSFPEILERCGDHLRGDFVLLSDTLSPSPEQIAITTGLRGMLTLELEVTGPSRDLHSGIHGGAVLNPIHALTDLLASLHDESGRVTVPGFYEEVIPPTEWEREELARLGNDVEAYRQSLGIPDFHTVDGLTPFEATRLLPTIEVNGIGGGYQGEGSKTIIPARAFAKLSCRLVPNQEPDVIEERVLCFLRDRCSPKVKLRVTPGHRGSPYRLVPPGRPDTPPDQNAALATAMRAAESAVTEVFGRSPIFLREGGSVPIIADLKKSLGMDSLMLGMFTPEDNLHAPDESFHLGMFANGITVSRRIFEALAT